MASGWGTTEVRLLLSSLLAISGQSRHACAGWGGDSRRCEGAHPLHIPLLVLQLGDLGTLPVGGALQLQHVVLRGNMTGRPSHNVCLQNLIVTCKGTLPHLQVAQQGSSVPS